MSNKKEKSVTIFDEPDIIDTYMKTKISSFTRNGGKNNGKVNFWTDDELELRNAVVLDYIGKKGYSREQTARELHRRWEIGMPTARRYIKDAIAALVENYKDTSQKEMMDTYKERIETILAEALEEKNKKVALQAIDMLNKMGGNYTERKDLNISGEQTINFGFKE